MQHQWGSKGGALDSAIGQTLLIQPSARVEASKSLQPIARSADGSEITLAEGNSELAKQFEHGFGGFLQIRGEAGSGKSVLLWRLADGLAALHSELPTRPAPLVLELHRWRLGESIDDFLRRESQQPGLNIDPGVLQRWIQPGQERIALLLDGLDEIGLDSDTDSSADQQRAQLLTALSEFHSRHAGMLIAFTSRPDAHDAAHLLSDLTTAFPVRLEPVPWTRVKELPMARPLREAADGSEALQARLGIPLWSSVMRATYSDVSSSASIPDPSGMSAKEFERRVYSDFIARVGQGLDESSSPRLIGQAKALAAGLVASGRQTFRMEDLQPPFLDRLDVTLGKAARWLGTLTTGAVAAALVAATTSVEIGYATGVAVSLAVGLGVGLSYGAWVSAFAGSSVGAAFWVEHGLVYATVIAVSLAAATYFAEPRADARNGPRLRLTLGRLSKVTPSRVVVGVGAFVSAATALTLEINLAVGLSTGLAVMLAGGRGADDQQTVRDALAPKALGAPSLSQFLLGLVVGGTLGSLVAVAAGLEDPILLGAAVGLALGLAYGFQVRQRIPTSGEHPLSGIRRSAMAGSLPILMTAIVVAILGYFFDGQSGLLAGAAVGFSLGLFLFIAEGLATLIFFRSTAATAALAGRMPWRLQAFLASLARRGLMYRIGPASRFLHRTLQEQLAADHSAAGRSAASANDRHLSAV